MFKLECFVEDKNLAKVLHLLAGHVMNLNTVPATNAAKKNGAAVPLTTGETAQLFKTWTTKNKIKEISAPGLRAFATANGYAEGSVQHIMSKLIAAKAVQKTNKRNGHNKNTIIYKVL